MNSLLKGLNQRQREAVMHTHGPLLVLAGAGSGKTRVLTHRVARLVREKHCRPGEILAVTFTNKAAREMRERIADLLSPSAAAAMTIATFHSFGVRILREDGEQLGLKRTFSILGDHERTSTLKGLARSTGRPGKQERFDELATRISLAKNASLDPEAFGRENPDERRVGRLYKAYRSVLLKRQTVDFDDLLLLPLQLFERHPDILAKYRKRYRFISIDEFQDTNAVQMKLARLLASPANNIMAVGDDDQGIYSWRGAEIENVIQFPTVFARCRTVVLDKNYRSTRQILEAAHAVVANNTKRKLKHITAVVGDGALITHHRGDDETEEAEWIAATIRDNVDRRHFTYTHHALLFRTNAMMRRFEEALRQAHIPYRVHGGTSFFERKEIKDVVAYLRFFANSDDELSLMRVLKVPNRGVTPSSMERLEELAGRRRIGLWEAMERHGDADGIGERQHEKIEEVLSFRRRHATGFAEGALSSTMRDILRECDYLEHLQRAHREDGTAEARREHVEEILHGLEIFEKRRSRATRTLAGYVQELSLSIGDEGQDGDKKSKGVSLMTLHKSKGLEFPIVFLCGLDDGVFPSPRALAEGGIAEERRLFYVGMTRAQRELVLTYPHTKVFRKKTVNVTPCRFLREIPEEFMDGKLGEREEEEREQFTADFFATMRQRFGENKN
jgi:superfamily I DNA/RNA helicase